MLPPPVTLKAAEVGSGFPKLHAVIAAALVATMPPAPASPSENTRPSTVAPAPTVTSPRASRLPTNAAPAPMVAGTSGVAGLSSPTCQNTLAPAHVAGAAIGATTDAPGPTVSAPATWKIQGPPPVSVNAPVSRASLSKQ